MKSNISVHTHERTYYAMNPIAINVKRSEGGVKGRGGTTLRRRRNACKSTLCISFSTVMSIRFRVSAAITLHYTYINK